MKITKMTLEEAFELTQWRYEEPYNFYDLDDSAQTINEFMDGSCYSARDEHDALIGFYCFGINAQVPGGRKEGLYQGEHVIDIGLGMKPELTGKGLGLSFFQTGMDIAKNEYNPKGIRLSVASFNKRAIKLYTKAGFKQEGEPFLSRGNEFIIMTLDLQPNRP
ncbi:ribosomal protein S18 acetylase RimI-like enzyme [Scopulibacillus darangshiensis]|uniref:Ribosomal protein S18 acetylase RimI-like enzyme n=1 Tax=Scopulibacillus darangshiensis TaxID=442528 RepID=A0A4R2P8I8_9BACL|nr:GNAT family N-acetyltransferase [Scopulibacillus darangshiensis]TCP31273.1 ribosomal protein S18 acetylase RimI-like enzyme [Scopulibacillus darangshiensis]